MWYSGDEYYSDEITSGEYLTDDERADMIAFLMLTGDFTEQYLYSLDDAVLYEIYSEYDI